MIDIIVDSLENYDLKSDTLLFIGHRVEDPYKINYNIILSRSHRPRWECILNTNQK